MKYEDVIKNGLSFSALRAYNSGIETFLAYRKGLKTQTEAMLKGQALDLYLLTPQKFGDAFTIADVNAWNEKGAKAIKEEIITSGKIPMKKAEFEEIQAIKKIVMAHPECSELLNNLLEAQTKFEWEHGGLPFIGYTDGISRLSNDVVKGQCIFDLKRTAKASYKEFIRQANNDILDVQGAMYQIAFEYKHKRTLPFVWLAVGSNWCGVVYMSPISMKQAREQYFELVERFKIDIEECNFENEFVPYFNRTFNRTSWRIFS